jgi:FADH2 O2-dependent halogenase
VRLSGTRDGEPLELEAAFVIDASGPGGFLARQLGIASGLEKTHTRSGLVFSHFTGVGSVSGTVPGLPQGPYPDDWAAVHHLIDEGWMYSLQFDHGVTSAGFALTPQGIARLGCMNDPERLWALLLERYPTIGAVFANASPVMPIRFVPAIQHRLTHAAGGRWVMLPHAYAFVDPLFSTGIAWSLRAIERLARTFEVHASTRAIPNADELDRYARMLTLEADQVDHMVAAAYEAMAHFDLFAAHAMLYFATVSFSEVKQRVMPSDDVAWGGFLGVGDAVLEPLARESLRRLREITRGAGQAGSEEDRRGYVEWAAGAIAPRNVAGLADPARHNLYPVDLDVLIERHSLLAMSREQLMEALPTLRGMAPEPAFADPRRAGRSTSLPGPRATAPPAPAPR